jgi:translation initiation factor 1
MRNNWISGPGWSFDPAISPPGAATRPVPEAGPLKISLEKRPRGKCVTLAAGGQLERLDRSGLLREIKVLCGSGGREVAGGMEIQGDHRERLGRFFAEKGIK